MVRGRRVRTHETSSSTTASAATTATVTLTVSNSQFTDDQYCASPKRKDCRIDDKKKPITITAALNSKQNKQNGVTKVSLTNGAGGDGGGHQRQIKDMFRTATRSQTNSIKNVTSTEFKCSSPSSIHSKIKNGCIKKIYANGNNHHQIHHINNHHFDDRDEDDDDDEEYVKVDDDDDIEVLSDINTMYPTNNNENYNNDDIIITINDDEENDNNTVDDVDKHLIRNKRNMKRSHQQNHRNNKNKNNSSNNRNRTTNIFLQEPVLCLNVDKSPNQPSSIKINKTLEVDPIFPSNNFHLNLNGQFDKIVTLSTSPKHDNDHPNHHEIITNNVHNTSTSDSFSNTVTNITTTTTNTTTTSTPTRSITINNCNNSILLNSDSNSCDSGVVIDTNKNELSPNRRRKPTTPHRILCPSPVKHPSVEKSSGISILTATNNNLTSSSASSLMMNGNCRGGITATSCLMNAQQKRHSKSRRRLNTNHYENNSTMTKSSSSSSPQLIGGIILSTDTLKKMNSNCSNHDNTNNGDLDEIDFTLDNNQKSILNSVKNPTAEQNTNNNYKSHHQPASNQQKPSNSHHHHHQQQYTKESKLSNVAPIPPIVDSAKIKGNKKVTDYFPAVRRSVRKTKKAVQEEIMRNIEKAIIEGREDGLKVEFFEGKGRGVVAERVFNRGEFVVEYIGDLITMAEANQREKKYSLDENAGCYMYYFKHRNQQYCIDATAESGKLGRLVNHSRNGNLITKVVVVKNRPHLVLIAKDDIQPGEELTYDYGDRSKESLLHHPWLAL